MDRQFGQPVRNARLGTPLEQIRTGRAPTGALAEHYTMPGATPGDPRTLGTSAAAIESAALRGRGLLRPPVPLGRLRRGAGTGAKMLIPQALMEVPNIWNYLMREK